MTSPKKIVLIEDDEAWKFIYHRLVQDIENVVICAEFERAEDTLEQMEKISPDIVIADVSLPGMSGLEFARRMRKRPNVKVIIVSSYRKEDLFDADIKGFEICYKGEIDRLQDIIKSAIQSHYDHAKQNDFLCER